MVDVLGDFDRVARTYVIVTGVNAGGRTNGLS
jgi:hypothetical protein